MEEAEEESMEVGLHREDALYQSELDDSVEQIVSGLM